LHISQQMPLPLTVSCSSKSRLVLTFLVLPFWCLLTQVVPDRFQQSSKTVVCVCVCVYSSMIYANIICLCGVDVAYEQLNDWTRLQWALTLGRTCYFLKPTSTKPQAAKLEQRKQQPLQHDTCDIIIKWD